ncbi:MAG: type II CRISPR RNA-guided endonuclease Cas9 [Alphaproteobacteria bacterium]|nr:type II CRISPR RNA-guided endonuclease Cas9 [Alphaproteobacteria bacterium]
MKKYKLGLDIGTNSIGWAVVSFEGEVITESQQNTVDVPLEIVKSGVRLFSDGREPDSKVSLAASRSTIKAQRKQKQRKINRVKLLNSYLLKENIISQENLDTHVYTLNAYEARANAVSNNPELNKVLRAILHLNKHRGYYDNSIIKPDLAKIKAEEYKNILKVMEEFLGEDNKFNNLTEEEKEKFVADILSLETYKNDTNKKQEFFNKWQLEGFEFEKEIKFKKDTKKINIFREIKNAKGLNDELSRIKKGIPHLAKILKDGNLTLGQFLYKQYLENEKIKETNFTAQKAVRFTPEGEYFASREMYEDEFERIKELSQKASLPISVNQWNRIHDIIFKQYPLQSKEHLIENCVLEEDEKVAPKTSPIFQKFRSLQFLNNLQYDFVDSESDKPSYKNLNQKQKEDLLNIINQENLTLKKLQDSLGKEYKDKILKTNWKVKDDNVLMKSNNTFAVMNSCLGDKWSNLTLESQDKLVKDILDLEFLDINENKKEDFYTKWQNLGELDNLFIEKGTTKTPKTIFTELTKEKGYANYSNKALLKLIDAWENTNGTIDKIIEQVYPSYSHAEEKGVLPTVKYELPYYGDLEVLKNSLTGEIYGDPVLKSDGNVELSLEIKRGNQTLTKKAIAKHGSQAHKELTTGKINNPTVHIALNQIRVVVNSIIAEMQKKFGEGFKFDDIHLEMARDIINSPATKKEIDDKNLINKNWNEFIDKELGHKASRDENRKLKLWYEQQGYDLRKSPKDNQKVEKAQCIYCGDSIGYTTDVEVDHILPISQTGDDSFTNLVLVCRQCNQIKENKTPYEAFSNHKDYNYDDLVKRAEKIYGKKNPKYLRFTPSGNEIAEKLRENFSNNQLNDTRYITKVAKQYLSALVENNHNVVCMQGKITSSYRHYLGLNEILNVNEENKKNRDDHRHHSLDAITVALINRGLVQKVSGELENRMQKFKEQKIVGEAYLKERKSAMGDILKYSVSNDLIKYGDFYNKVKESLNSIIPSVKVNHKTQSALYKDTAYGIVLDSKGEVIRNKEGQYLIKERKAIDGLSLGDISSVICLNYKANPEEPYNAEEDSLRMDIRKYLAENGLSVFQTDMWNLKKEIKEPKGKEAKELSNLLKTFGEHRGIKKVSLKYYATVKPINQKQKRKDTYSQFTKDVKGTDSPYKAYVVDSYKCVDIYQISKGVDRKTNQENFAYQGNFILYADFAEHKGNRGAESYKNSENFKEILTKDKNPKFLMRLHKEDTVVAYKKEDGKIDSEKDIQFLFVVKGLQRLGGRLDLRPLLLSDNKQQPYNISTVLRKEPKEHDSFFNLKKVAVLPNGEIRGIQMESLPKEYKTWLEDKKKEAKKDKKSQENNNPQENSKESTEENNNSE